jgi:hypothetical protein
MNITRSAQIGIATAAALIIGLLLVVIHEQPSAEVVPMVSTPVETSSTYLVETTTTVTQLTQIPSEFSRESRRIAVTTPSTTTSEVPPPLTPEQEAKIQAGLEESDPDSFEHMPHDYDLPSETTIEFVETQTP